MKPISNSDALAGAPTKAEIGTRPAASLLDTTEIKTFLEALDPRAPQFIFYSLDHAGKCEQRIGLMTDSKMLRWAGDQQHKGCSLYVAGQEMKGRRRLNSEVQRFRVVCADFDDGLPDKRLPLDPMIVETSESRYQALWFVSADGPQLSEAEWRGMNRRLAQDYGADLNAAKPAQGVRLAGTINHKPDRNRFRVTIVNERCDPYAARQLLDAFPPLADPEPAFNAKPYAPGEARPKLTDVMQARHRLYFDRGFGDDVARLAAMTAGRNDYLYRRVCRWAKYVHHNIVGRGEFERPLIEACQANGKLAEDKSGCLATIRGGLAKTRNDRIDDLTNRPRPQAQRTNSKPGGADPPSGPSDPDGTDREPQLATTETEIARLFEAQAAGKRLYDHSRGVWREYDASGGIWPVDEMKGTQRAVQELCEGLRQPRFQTLKTIRAVEELAKASPSLSVTSEAFDKDPFMLGTPGGHVCLKTGRMLAGDPARRITMSTAVAPLRMQTPVWNKFMGEATGNDADLIRFLQTFAGICATGDTREQCMLFMYGPGGGGKGTFLGTLSDVLGSYSWVAPIEAFSAGPDKHPTTFASMAGRRLVSASETEHGRKWAEARIKHITGQDRINARFMRKDEFQYQPNFKLIISGNRAPGFENCDDAIRRRFHVVPFDRRYVKEEADMGLKEKLRAEWPGILQWAIDGCLIWQRDGLVVPEKVREATSQYFDAQDSFGQWLEQETTSGERFEATYDEVFKSWARFAKDVGEPVGSVHALTERLVQAGFKRLKPTKRKIKGEWKSVRVMSGLMVSLPDGAVSTDWVR